MKTMVLLGSGALATLLLSGCASQPPVMQAFNAPADGALWHRYQAMKCASLLREAMWSMVSEITSTLDIDYAAYTAENLTAFHSACAALKSL